MRYIILLACLGIWGSHPIVGQVKKDLAIGIGNPELTNIGLRLQIVDIQLGFGIGIVPSANGLLTTTSFEFYWNYAGSSKLSTRKPWYGKLFYSIIRDNNPISINRLFTLNLRLGRELNISRKVGFSLDIGPIFELSRSSTQPGGFYHPPEVGSIGFGTVLFIHI